jgi:hypothetical protein
LPKLYLAMLVLSIPMLARAAVPIEMSCDMSVKEFFAPLVQQRLISSKPFKIEGPSVNYFRPAMFKQLVVFGLPVTTVVGFTDDPLLFISNGKQQRDVFGVIVGESIANVQAQLNAVSATGTATYRIGSNSTIIVCKGELQ